MPFIEISAIGAMFTLVKSPEGKVNLIRKYVSTCRLMPLQSFHSWLQEQPGMQNVTEFELDELYQLTFGHSNDEVFDSAPKQPR